MKTARRFGIRDIGDAEKDEKIMEMAVQAANQLVNHKYFSFTIRSYHNVISKR